MKFKNFFLSCSSTSGSRSRKLEDKYSGLRPVSPTQNNKATFYPIVEADVPPPPSNSGGVRGHGNKGYHNPHHPSLTNSYSSYSCGSNSSGGSSGIGGSSGGEGGSASLSKNKRVLDAKGGRNRSSLKNNSSSGGSNKCRCHVGRECCIDDKPTSPKGAVVDLGVKVGDRVIWLRESPHSNESGIVKWIGIIDGEEIAGIEFDRPLSLGSGWYRNKQLFTCDKDCGGLVSVAGLILEEDYFFNPETKSLSPSPLDYNSSADHLDLVTSHHHHSLNKSLNNSRGSSSGLGSAGHSSPSPSPSSSSSSNNSLEIHPVSSQAAYFPVSSSTGLGLPPTRPPPPSSQSLNHPFTVANVDTYHLNRNANGWSSPSSGFGKTERETNNLNCTSSNGPTTNRVAGSYQKSDERIGRGIYPSQDLVDSGGRSNTSVMPIPQIEAPLKEEQVEQIQGRQKGIQGHRNSCYLDATLFSMFSFSSVFDSILLQDFTHRPNRRRDAEDEKLARNVQKILRDEIVNPLRKDSYCSANNVMRLRQTMEHLDPKLTSEEMDPQEFLQMLFDKVLNLEEFMSLSSGQSDFFHQVLVQQREEDRHKIPTIQQLFEQSLMLQELKLKSVPQPALILQMPRSGNKYKMYDGILPNLQIDITDLLEDIPRECIICGSLATFECALCYGEFQSGGETMRDSGISSPVTTSGAESTAFCDQCVRITHMRKDRTGHVGTVVPIKYSFPATQYFPNALLNSSLHSPTSPSSFGVNGNWGNPSFNRSLPTTSLISSIPPPSSHQRSIPRVTMDLFAVICIETSHFVSYVKCGTDRNAPWVFFDSMADRVENANGTGHNIPQVRLLPKMGNWLDELEKQRDVKKLMEEGQLSPELKRLITDPYICLYYSKESSMYG